MERANASISQILERTDELYSRRSDIACIRECVQLLKSIETEEFEVAWRLGRAWFFLGQEANTASDKRKHFRLGIEASEKSVSLMHGRVEGQFWLGVNLALLANEVNLLTGAKLALQAKKALLRAIAIDPGFHGAGPLRVLARLEHKMPAVLGGGMKRARDHFEQAIELSRFNTVTRIFYAELLRELGEPAAANTQLETVLNVPDDEFWQFEIDRDKRLAREIKLAADERIRKTNKK